MMAGRVNRWNINHFLNPVPYKFNGNAIRDANDEAKRELNRWLIGKRFDNIKDDEKMMSISSYRKMMEDGMKLIKGMNEKCQELNFKMEQLDGFDWKREMEEINSMKERVAEIEKIISDPEIIKSIKRKISKRVQKRRSIKKHKEIKKKWRIQEKIRKGNQEEEINSFLKKQNDKLMAKKREEQVQKEADLILSEVKKKLNESKKLREKIQIIEKIRHVFKDSAERKSLYTPIETDKAFNEKIIQLKNTVDHQISIYLKEERALKVMLESDAEDRHESRFEPNDVNLIQKKQLNIIELLFGTEAYPNPGIPGSVLNWQYYDQANHCHENLINIRRAWDSYLTHDGGSSIPTHWVVPPSTPSKEWAKYIVNREET